MFCRLARLAMLGAGILLTVAGRQPVPLAFSFRVTWLKSAVSEH